MSSLLRILRITLRKVNPKLPRTFVKKKQLLATERIHFYYCFYYYLSLTFKRNKKLIKTFTQKPLFGRCSGGVKCFALTVTFQVNILLHASGRFVT